MSIYIYPISSFIMPIQYSEITIIINLEKEPIMNYFNRLLLGNENETNDNDTIIILFEDSIIHEVKKECTNNSKIIICNQFRGSINCCADILIYLPNPFN